MSAKHLTVVTIGGGTGTFPVIRALSSLEAQITAIVTASDSGGSTGRIRDEFGFVPVGDLRQSLAALADEKQQAWISKLLLYRFNRGNGLKGHNLGNLILTALQDMTSSTTEALDKAADIFRLQGKVVPVTEDNVQLKIHYQDGSSLVGEHYLDEPSAQNQPIAKVELVPNAVLNPEAQTAILTADVILIGPGDFYASLMAVLVTPGLKEVLSSFKGKIIYFGNLMTSRSQTQNMSLSDYVEKIEAAIGRSISTIVINSEPITAEVLARYQKYGDQPVANDFPSDARLIEANLLDPEASLPLPGDQLSRSVLRHDATKISQVLLKIL